MKTPLLPAGVQRVDENEHFAFNCHGGISCFTVCCRQLELALTPYDVLRLKNALGISSGDFLNDYVIIEREENEYFPRLYLTMVDDGRAGCVFVTEQGCSVYQDRPGACRAYPLGRGSRRGADNNGVEHFFVLLHEQHCRGFAEKLLHTPREYCSSQGLNRYNLYNDALIPLLQHPRVRQGMRLTSRQQDTFILALYDIDSFRNHLFSGETAVDLQSDVRREDLRNDEKLLQFSINWLMKEFFQEERRITIC